MLHTVMLSAQLHVPAVSQSQHKSANVLMLSVKAHCSLTGLAGDPLAYTGI